MNQNSIIITAADYKVALNIPGAGVFMLQTMGNIGWSDTAENELIYAVGDEYPIGNKQNAFKFSGKFSIQEGEMYNILVNAGLDSAIQIPNATLSITSLLGGPSYTYIGVCINSSTIDVKAKDKESMRNMDFTAMRVIAG